MATLEQMKAEARRRGLSSTNSAPTPTEPKPQGASAGGEYSVGQLYDALSGTPQQRGVGEQLASMEGRDVASALGEGALLGAGDAAAAGIAAGIAKVKDGADFTDTYSDIRGDLQRREDERLEETPEASSLLTAAGMGMSLGPGLVRGGAALSKSTAAALKRGSLKAAAKTKPRVRVRDGQAVASAAVKTPSKLNKTWNRMKRGTSSGATLGAEADAVGVAMGDHSPDNTLTGAAAGMAFNTPLGRWAGSRLARAVLGDKARVLYYMGSHPVSRRHAKLLRQALGGVPKK